jgi:hypothetical protein
MSEKKRGNYVGYLEMPRINGRLKFTLEDLEQLKTFATEKGNIYLDLVVFQDKETGKGNQGRSFCAVWDPRSADDQPSRSKKPQTDDLPF